MTRLSASPSGRLAIRGDTPITRLGFGAMRITGPGTWGEPLDRPEAIRVAMPETARHHRGDAAILDTRDGNVALLACTKLFRFTRRAATALLFATTFMTFVTRETAIAQTRLDIETHNKAIIQAGFDAWKNGTGSPFDSLAPDAVWTIPGNSPESRTFNGREEFMSQVIRPFNARMSSPLLPTVKGLYADGDTVIVLFDAAGTARDGKPYTNSYAWFLRLRGDQIVEATAFFDTIEFTDFWNRVAPKP